MEALFAELKNHIGLRRLRLRRLKFVREQFFPAAVAQTISDWCASSAHRQPQSFSPPRKEERTDSSPLVRTAQGRFKHRVFQQPPLIGSRTAQFFGPSAATRGTTKPKRGGLWWVSASGPAFSPPLEPPRPAFRTPREERSMLGDR